MDSDTHSTGKGPVANLAVRRIAGQVKADPVQEKIVLSLQAVHEQLAALVAEPPKPGLLARLGLVSVPKPVICAVDRGMVKGMLETLYGDTDPALELSLPRGDDVCVTAF